MQIVDNHPNFTQLQFCIEMVKMLIGDFSSWQHAVQEGTVQTGHWLVKMSKGRCNVPSQRSVGWDVIHVVRGSAWIVSRITVRKPDMAQNLNALNNERSFASVIKTL